MAPTLTVLSVQARPVPWNAAATLEKLEHLVRMHRIETLDLGLVRDARANGTRGMSRVLEHARNAPPAVFRAARPPRASD